MLPNSNICIYYYVKSYSSYSSSSSSLCNIIFYSYFYILSMSPRSIIPPPIMAFNIAISILFYMPISSAKSPRSPIPPIIIKFAKSFIYLVDGFLLRPFALPLALFVLLILFLSIPENIASNVLNCIIKIHVH